jgi:hypothetical protein
MSEQSGYGFARPENPHDFHPDSECCSPEEIAAHKAACDAYDAGKYEHDGWDGWNEDHTIHVLRAPWGIGSYVFRDKDAEDALAALYAARKSLAAHLEAHKALVEFVMGKDLYAVLMDAANTTMAPATPGMATAAILKIDALRTALAPFRTGEGR